MEQLEMHARSGLPLGLAVASFGDASPRRLRRKCSNIVLQIEAGKKLSAAVRTEFRMPGVVAGILDAGERSGTLPEALGSCKRFLEREEELIKRSLSASAYPAVIACATVLLTVGLVEGIMPQIIPMLASLHGNLPLLTRLVMALSAFLARYWWECLISILGSGSVLVILFKKSQ